MFQKLPDNLNIRNSKPDDHNTIISVMKDWWDGRDLTWLLPKLYLDHFCNTSFIVEKKDILKGFLIGFMSPANINEGYIHFVGVHPEYHGMGIGKYMYEQFFDICKKNNRDIIRSCTSHVNKGSIAFHTKIGFKILPGDAEIEGLPVTLAYNKPDDPKVLFEKKLRPHN